MPELLFVYYNIFIASIAASHQAGAVASDDLEVGDVQNLFYQIIALLGLSLIIYLYINFRNNRTRRPAKQTPISIAQEAKNISHNLQQVVDLIPYPACISNENQKVIYSNTRYNTLVGSISISTTPYWDKQLHINYQPTHTQHEEQFIAKSNHRKRYKISTTPIGISDISFQLYTVVIEQVTNSPRPKNETDIIKETITNADFPIILIDDSYKIADFNQFAIALLDSKDLYQQSILALFPDDEHEALIQLINSGNETGIHKTFHLLSRKTPLVPVEVYHISIMKPDKKVNLFILIDISERQQMAAEILRAKLQAEESDRLKSSFLANMSHEVRTPLNSIMGFTELMCDEQLSPEERKEYHSIVKTSSNELLRLLNDIIEFSKIESGLVKLELTDSYAHEIVNELSEEITPLVSNKPAIKFMVEEPIGFETPVVRTDIKRVIQTLRYLIDNALKFTYKGSVTLSYQYRPDSSIEFIVSDTGIGIPKEKIPNIFHKFRQANDDNSRDFGGAGLGLSIAKHLANVLGGFLWVSSVEKVGSDFHFILPGINSGNPYYKHQNTILFYSKKPQTIPFTIADVKILPLYQFTALINVPIAHHISAILLDAELSREEMTILMAIPQLQTASIILYNPTQSIVLYSPIAREKGSKFTDIPHLKRYISKCAERQPPDKTTKRPT
ncbi:ATP-binding protein [Carboxylicivirga taeanensis]|uniref:PAS domain-containing sensor histidine kinase n=1 Tax=Carboxylicivirga taeanensis TaxID=1416875 RepID=UPI003F6DDD36